MNNRKFAAGFLSLLLLAASAGEVLAQSGRELYEQKCSRCHAAFEPDRFSSLEWPGLVRSMKSQAKLSESEVAEIEGYLVAAAPGEASAGGSAQLSGYLYTEYFRTEERTKNFDLHYLALQISGWLNESVAYLAEFELEHGGEGGETFVEQAYIDYWLKPNVALRIGGMLTPFNRFDEFHEPLLNRLVTRPMVSSELGVSAWKEVGVDLHGYVPLGNRTTASFDLYTINGLGDGANLRGSRQYRDNNEALSLGGRVNLLVNDLLEVGGSYYSGAWDDAGEQNLALIGAHLLLAGGPGEIHAEYTSATSENPGALADGEMSGWFLQGSRRLDERTRATLRYGVLDYLDPGDQLGRDPAKGNKDATELSFGFNFLPTPDLVFKAEYTIIGEGDRMADVDNNQIAFQAALNF